MTRWQKYIIGDTVKVGFGTVTKVREVTTMGHYKLEGQNGVFSETELKLVQRKISNEALQEMAEKNGMAGSKR
jgi:hypothetical protein